MANPGKNAGAGKRVLLLCVKTGYQTREFVRAAERLGAEVVFGTDRCHRMDDPWSDGALALRFEDLHESARQIAEFAGATPVDAIVAVGDRPTPAAGLACEQLGLRGNPLSAAEACRDKHQSRERLRAAGLLVPAFERHPIDADSRAVADATRYPCVLKPLALSGSRGVIRANNPEEFAAAFDRIGCLLHSPEVQVLREETNNFVQVEEYVPGREVALEGLLIDGELKTLALFDKPDALEGPFFEETIYVTPSRLPAETQSQVRETVELAARALALTFGPVHAELRLNDRGAWILEVAARCIGGLCARALRFTGGMGLEELILRQALGEDVSAIEREEQAAAVMMIPIPEAGVFEGVVNGLSEKPEGIEDIIITAKPGQKLLPLPEGGSYLGFIFARAATPEAAEHALRSAHSQLSFRFAPILPVVSAAGG